MANSLDINWRLAAMADGENGPSSPQNWLMINLDKRQHYQLTDRFAKGLGIFWNFYKYGSGNSNHIDLDYDVVDLLTRSHKEWPRETAFVGEVVANLDRMRQ
jgi:hypothetical protein